MNSFIKHLLLLSISFLLIGCSEKKNSNIDPPIDDQPIVEMTRIPLFEQPFGYASLSISNRTDELNIIQVQNEIEFLDALLLDDGKIIEIQNDLNLGSNYVEAMLLDNDLNLEDFQSVYRSHSRQPLLHPTLLEQGVGQVRIVLRNNLMIYSKDGSTIKHASFLIDGSTDIVFRNLRLSGLWEWDELDQGQYKRNDWDYFLIEKSQGVWLDHLTFEQAYDGIIDVKEESSNITLSWSKLDFTPNPFVVAQIDHLENNRENNPFYDGLRTNGMEIDDIVLYASFQKKGFNLGNTTDGEGFESITMTFHHLEITNLQDRMPRIRKGDVHVYHIILDNQDIDELRTKYNHISLSIINQGIVTTEAGSVLMEHSIFKYVSTPIKNHQDSNPDIRYTGRYKVVNSELVKINNTYFGSSDDPITIWRHHNDLEPLTFELRNHDEIPYVYQKRDVYFLAETFSEYPTGHQHIESFSWLYTNQTNN